MDPESRYDTERRKWDAHAHATLPSLDDLPVIPEGTTLASYSRGKILLDGMGPFLGDLAGREVVEYGCGLGELTMVLARSGARVTSVDLSPASVEFTRQRAERHGLADRITFVVAAAETLPFPDASFDVAVGKAVLHHLEPATGAAELARILRPGGRAAFSEPLGMNPLLVFAREHLPYPGKHDRGADRPLTADDVRAWRAPFASLQIRPVQLFSMVERAFGFQMKLPPLRALDRALLRRWPRLGRFCRYGIMLFEKAPADAPSARLDSVERRPRPAEEVAAQQVPLEAPERAGALQASDS